MARMKKTSKDYCQQCKYHMGGDTDKACRVACQYILKTGKRRGCPVGLCDKFEQLVKKEKNKIPWEDEVLPTLEEMSY